ncbi:hypothetical protein [Actinomadura terrae]|uniref:hypothetical protein n=1 Tax=Actinomadura terrae TaxID=604353 RepID=UPI001FA6B8AE|nr:hypothetical protein [Actinomadura terrae]
MPTTPRLPPRPDTDAAVRRLAVIQRWTVRAVLIWTGAPPARYQRYLDEAQQRVLLRRFGGGYVFLHGKLRTHLTEDPENSSAA